MLTMALVINAQMAARSKRIPAVVLRLPDLAPGVQVVMTKALAGADEARMLSLAGSAERTSSHPVASALVGCAAARGVPVDLPVAACSSVPGTASVFMSRLRLTCIVILLESLQRSSFAASSGNDSMAFAN